MVSGDALAFVSGPSAMRLPSRSRRRGRRRLIAASLTALALAGCVNRFGNMMKGGNITVMIYSVSDADFLCEKELPYDSIYPPDWPLANGLSDEQQRNRYYQKCMARYGHPEQTVAPPPPPA
jgi:hypothetical protein